MADSSQQNMFEFSAEDSLLGEIWRTKFQDKEKSLVKSIHEEIPIVLAEQVCHLNIICEHVIVQHNLWSPVRPVCATVAGARPVSVSGMFSHQHGLLRHHHSLCICPGQGITLQTTLQPSSYQDDGGRANAENHWQIYQGMKSSLEFNNNFSPAAPFL